MSDAGRPRQRRRRLRWPPLAAAAATAAAGMAALVALSRPAAETARFVVADDARAAQTAVAAYPLAEALRRCRALPADAEDRACRAAWEAHRRRFFGH